MACIFSQMEVFVRNIGKWMATTGLVLALAGGLLAADWPQFRGPNGSGVVADATGLAALNTTAVWKIPLGDGFGQIAVAGDKSVVFAERGEDELAVGLDTASGKEVWATPIDKSIKENAGGNGPRSTPSIDGEHVYIYGTHMKLVCLELAGGKQVWEHDVQKEFGGKEPQWGSAASPVVVDDLVIAVGGGAGHGIMAFDKKDGKLAWAKTNEKFTHATPTLATIAGVKQVICFMQSGLVSVEPKTGEILWMFAHRYSTSTAASPVVGGKNGDVVYCSAGYGVGAAACRVSNNGGKWTAAELWSTPGKNLSHWSTPVCVDGCIYGLFGQNKADGPLACLDIETGKVNWSEPGFGSQGGIIAVGDKLVIQTPKGDLVLVDASSAGFKELGRTNVLKGKNWTAPAYVDGMIFARNSSQNGSAEGVCLKLK